MKSNNAYPFKVFYLFSITLLLLLWLEQRSINAYWIQTYHRTSPLAALEKYASWRMGGEITSKLGIGVSEFEELLADFNNSSIRLVNSYLNSPIKQQSPLNEQILLVNSQAVFKPSHLLLFPHEAFIKFLPQHKEETEVNEAINYFPSILVIRKNIEQTINTTEDHRILIDKGEKVFFVGDSLMQGVAPHVMRILLKKHNIESINLSKQSTGLAYPKFFNWPQVAEDTFEKNANIKLMVVFMGANDPWDFPINKGGRFVKFASPEWEGVYRVRIQRLINVATSHGAEVLWIGPPNMSDKKLNAGVIKLNKIYQSQVTIAKQHYITANDVLGMKDDNFVKFMNIPNKGNVTLRTDDGIHFTTIGQKRIADKIMLFLRFNEATETTK